MSATGGPAPGQEQGRQLSETFVETIEVVGR